jgi:hypothetical protein
MNSAGNVALRSARLIVARAGGPQALAKRLKVGKDWAYRRLNGETPIKEKDKLLIAQAMADERRGLGDGGG